MNFLIQLFGFFVFLWCAPWWGYCHDTVLYADDHGVVQRLTVDYLSSETHCYAKVEFIPSLNPGVDPRNYPDITLPPIPSSGRFPEDFRIPQIQCILPYTGALFPEATVFSDPDKYNKNLWYETFIPMVVNPYP